MDDFKVPRTYEEAREIGVYWDWNAILLTRFKDRLRSIAVNLLEKEGPIENVYEAVGLSEEKLKSIKAHFWERVCAAVDEKSIPMSVCIRAIVEDMEEKIKEIAETAEIAKNAKVSGCSGTRRRRYDEPNDAPLFSQSRFF